MLADLPRWLDAIETARYICVRPDSLARLVRQGRIPQPNRQLGDRSPRWDRLALDAAFDGGTESTNLTTAVLAYVEKNRQKRKADSGGRDR